MCNKNLYILEDENNNDVINFFLTVFDEKINWDVISKYNFVNYIDSGFIEGNEYIPSGNYHRIEFNLSNIKIESLKEKMKNFIETTFEEIVNNENEFIDLILNLKDYFSKNKYSSELKFIEDVFAMLILINYLLDNKLVDNNFLHRYYSINDKFLDLNINETLNLSITFKKNLKVKYEEGIHANDFIAVEFMPLENKKINVLEMFDILKLKGLIFNDKLNELKKIISFFDLNLINKKTLIDLKDIKYYYYNSEDIPIIEVLDFKKCKQIIFKMDYSLSSEYNEEELKNVLKAYFKD